MVSEPLLQWDTHIPTHNLSQCRDSALPSPHTRPGPPLLQNHRLTAKYPTRSGLIKHTTSMQGHLPHVTKTLQILPLWTETCARERGGAPVELAQVRSGADGASQLPTKLTATRGLVHESTSARLCTASLPLPLVPSSQKAPC